MTPSSSLTSKLTNTILDSKIEDEIERPRTYPSNPRSPILQRTENFNGGRDLDLRFLFSGFWNLEIQEEEESIERDRYWIHG